MKDVDVNNGSMEELVASINDNTKMLKGLYSYRVVFIRGIMQGLGIIIGSTIIAGIGYTVLTQFVSPEILHDISIDAAVERNLDLK